MAGFDHPWPALEAAAHSAGDREALVFAHQSQRLSFAQWRDDALALAGGLAARGLKAGDRLALLAENRVEWPVVQMASAALGTVLVPLNTHYRTDDLAYALGQSGARMLIASTAFRSNPYLETVTALKPGLPALSDVFALETDYQALIASPPWTPAAPDPGAVAALLYTSGTTGFPKGALLSHRAMMRDARATAQRLGLKPGDRWTSIVPLFHCAGCIMNLLGGLQCQAAYVGIPAFSPEAMFALIAGERCTFLTGVPTSYLAMLDHPARSHYDLSSLRAGTCGGADCNPGILARCAAEFPMPGLVQVYGQTEGATLFTCPAPEDPQRWATAGTALDGYELRIADPDSLAPLPAGTIGEIQARGLMVMEGYDRNPQATAETILPDGFLRTGDLGYLTQDGHLVIAGGRLRDMIIRGGENIYPAEIENVLQEHPAIAGVAVFGVADAYYGEIVAAAVRLAQPVDAAALQAFCAARIARFKVPARFYRAGEFPLTASGKIRKVALRAAAAAGELTVIA